MEKELQQAIVQTGEREVAIDGYFQNEKFFEEVADEIRVRFAVDPQLPVECRGKTPVGIQIRRGDFIGQSNYDLCRPAYFRDAMKVIVSLVPSPLFIAVSDDLAWCREFFKGSEDVFVPDSQDEWEGLATMIACKALVISNSTFGWWGAWLSGAEIVVAPDPFLGDQPWDCVPSRWIRMPASGVVGARESNHKRQALHLTP